MTSSNDRRPKSRPAAATSISSRSRSLHLPPKGAYAAEALQCLKVGLLPIPCGGPDGKKPLVKFAGDAAPTEQTVRATVGCTKFRGAGIGILTGAGERPLTVVDIDDPGLVPAVLAALGPTPIMVRTPSGGTHLYYRHGGEGCTNLRPGLRVDIKGRGGFVIAPPTVRLPSASHPGGAYRFEVGSLARLDEMPRLPADWRSRLERLAGPAETKPVQGNGVLQVTGEEIKLIGSAEAFWLLAHLRMAHGSRNEPFALVVRAMAEHESVPGMGEMLLRRARARLLETGFLQRVHAGGKGPGDPAKFLLGWPAEALMRESSTQCKDTPSGLNGKGDGACSTEEQPAIPAAPAPGPVDMTKGTPTGRQGAGSSDGVIIDVGGEEPAHLVTSKLLACIARPPGSATAPAWLELVAALAQTIVGAQVKLDPDLLWQPQLLVPAQMQVPPERALKLAGTAFEQINRAMGAAHAQMPALVRGVAASAGSALSTLPPDWRGEGTLVEGSERVLRQEADFTEFLELRGEAPPARFPSIDSAGAPVNFRNRIVAPFRNVLHLAAGLAQVLDDIERELGASQKQRGSPASLGGFGAYPHRPRLLIEHVLLVPEIAVAAINRAQRLEGGLAYLPTQRPKPERVVKLRWKAPIDAKA